MRTYLVWLILISLAAVAASQLLTAQPMISPVAAGFALLVLGMVAGLRIGADSVGRFVKDLARLNNYLAEQNRDLAEMNRFLLDQILFRERKPPDSPDSVEPEDGDMT